MSFFYAKRERLPIRGQKKLPLRGKKSKRLALLKDYTPGRVYTFVDERRFEDIPDNISLWADADRLQSGTLDMSQEIMS